MLREEHVNEAIQTVQTLNNLDQIESLRIEWLGKKGHLTQALKSLSTLSNDERKEQGMRLNLFKQKLVSMLETQRDSIVSQMRKECLDKEKIDVTLPARQTRVGAQHPIHRTIAQLIQWFSDRGFEFVTGPEVETEYYNFTALNFPEEHPSKEMHDTFYLEDDLLLRTHTSAVQIRCMHNRKPPFSFITAGKTFRCDSDRTHLPMFHQLEGMVVSETTSYAELKGLLTDFLKHLFGSSIDIRFRPSYFPFTEPSAEVDIRNKDGQWLEVLGCGMIHPNVLMEAKIDPDEYRGFAFGVGIDRLAMLLYGVGDIRNFVLNDLDFLGQFN